MLSKDFFRWLLLFLVTFIFAKRAEPNIERAVLEKLLFDFQFA